MVFTTSTCVVVLLLSAVQMFQTCAHATKRNDEPNVEFYLGTPLDAFWNDTGGICKPKFGASCYATSMNFIFVSMISWTNSLDISWKSQGS